MFRLEGLGGGQLWQRGSPTQSCCPEDLVGNKFDIAREVCTQSCFLRGLDGRSHLTEGSLGPNPSFCLVALMGITMAANTDCTGGEEVPNQSCCPKGLDGRGELLVGKWSSPDHNAPRILMGIISVLCSPFDHIWSPAYFAVTSKGNLDLIIWQ